MRRSMAEVFADGKREAESGMAAKGEVGGVKAGSLSVNGYQHNQSSRGPDLASATGRCDGVDSLGLVLRQRRLPTGLHMLLDLLG